MGATGPLHDESRDPLDLLAEQFLLQVRRGAAVTPASFAAAHPQHQAALLDLLPTLLLLEQAKRDRESSASGGRRFALPQLQRLGDFAIVRELGRGGMGVVFEAMQESLGRRVALKVLPQASLLTGNQLERFRREAQTAARLHHTNIVPVFDSGEADGFHYYAMQFIDGKGLDRVVREARAADPAGSGAVRDQCRLAASIGVAVADALEHAHGQGTLHRDIKPANLLLDDKQHVWVTDFGLAKALQQEGLTHSGDVLGTLQYMAPEQFAGQYDARSEVYALGVTLHELIALRPAFAAATRSELIDHIRAGRCERLHKLVPAVPRDLATIVGRATAVEPRARYASARELGDDLRAFLEDRPIAARRQATAARLLFWCRRNRALAGAGAVAALAVLVAAIVGWSAYWTTADALQQVKTSAALVRQESERNLANLDDTLQVFEDVFDTLVGPDPLHALVEDDADGTADVALRAPLGDDSLALLGRMLAFYEKFAERNQGSLNLAEQTARAYARVGAIQARLGDLDAAVLDYDQAIARFRDLRDHDRTRDLAGLQQELGQVQLRRRQPAAAAECFARSLQLRQGDANDRGRPALRLQARAHYLLATARRFREGRPPERGGRRNGPFAGRGRGRDAPPNARGGDRRGSEPRPGERPADGRPGEPPAPHPRVGDALERLAFERATADERSHLAAALALLDGLLAEQPEDADSQMLKARCLVALARIGQRFDPAAAQAQRAAAVAILRQLVVAHPDGDSYRFELADALLASVSPRGGAADVEASTAAVVEAERLYRAQPTHPEYQALLARCLGMQANAMHQRSGADATAGIAELNRALALQRTLVVGRDSVEPHFAMELLDSLRRLLRVQVDGNDIDGARVTAQELIDRMADAVRIGVLRQGEESARPGDIGALFDRAGLRDLMETMRTALRQAAEERSREPDRRGR